MDDVHGFGIALLVAGVGVMLAVAVQHLTERSRIPTPAVFLGVAAVASDLVPRLGELSITTVQRVVTVALVLLLFDGGLHIGRGRFRVAAGAIVWIGVAGTFATTAAIAAAAHYLLGLGWLPALLLGTALAPTDPAVVFSVLGRREVAGRSATILEGESGANDPVGIALMASLLAASTGGLGGGDAVAVLAEFARQMALGTAVGVAGGLTLLALIRRVPLPNAALYPLRVLGGALALYGLATLVDGSGFLAVFVAGILLGDERAPFKEEIERFHAVLASLGEIVAFTALGLTIDLAALARSLDWLVGLALAVLLAFVIRPALVGLLLLPVRLTWAERAFVLWAGLKGAVPILLGTFIVAAHAPDADRLYRLVVVVVAFSVIVQGGLVPAVAQRLGLSIIRVTPEPPTRESLDLP